MTLLEFISVLAIYSEIAVLAYFDYRLWKTMYTPLNLLMLPYAAILMVTILSAGSMGIVEFYYPSVVVWMFGLLLFAIPSHIMAYSFKDRLRNEKEELFIDNVNMNSLNIMSILLVVAFLVRFVYMAKTTSMLPGSDDFGYEYCGKGVWGHLHRALHVLSAIYIYKYDKSHKWYILLVLAMFFVTLMYGVKSWVLIPTVAGICMRLYTKKMKLSFMLFVKVFIMAFAVFLVTYTFSLLLGRENADTFGNIFQFICSAFVHYVISGTMGWSQDLQQGILETPNFDVLVANVLNLYHVVAGNEYVQAINPFFIHNGVNGSNVRSFFGTVYINSNILQFVLLTLTVSFVIYFAKLWTIINKTIYVNVFYYFVGGLLIMGWFDYFLYTLPAIEVPAWVLIIYFITKKRGTENPLPVSQENQTAVTQ